jgi:hypothetical protein
MDAQQLIFDRTRVGNIPTELPAIADPFGEYPALSRLRLTSADINELAHQGFLSVETRGKRIIHKLRFRRGNQQVVRSLGDAAEAAVVKTELDRLQSRRRICRELATFERAARRLLGDAKAQLKTLIAAHGLKFHGRDVRRPRLTS